MAKEKKEKKSRIPTLCNIKRFVAAVGGAFVLLGASIGLFGCNKHQSQTEVTTPPYKTEQEVTKQLPDFEDSLKFYEELGADTSYLSYDYTSGRFSNPLDNTRLAASEDPIAFNICIDDLSEKAKQIFENTASDLNEVFEAINPKYRFEVDFDPDRKAINNKYNIDVYLMTEEEMKEHPNYLGFWTGTTVVRTVDGQSTQDSIIKLHEDALEMQGVFTHEVLHHLGLGDAYKVTKTESIMQAGEQKYIRRNDLILLAGKYGDYSTPEKKAELIDFIDSYSARKEAEEQEKEYQERLAKFNETKQALADYLDVQISDLKPIKDGSIFIKNEMEVDENNIHRISSSTFIKDGQVYTGCIDKFLTIKSDDDYTMGFGKNFDFFRKTWTLDDPLGSTTSTIVYAMVNGVPYKASMSYKGEVTIESLGEYSTQDELEILIAMEHTYRTKDFFKDASTINNYKYKKGDSFAIVKDGEVLYNYDLKSYDASDADGNPIFSEIISSAIIVRDTERKQWILLMPVSADGTLLCYGYTFDEQFFKDEYKIIPLKGKQISDILDLSKEVEQ